MTTYAGNKRFTFFGSKILEMQLHFFKLPVKYYLYNASILMRRFKFCFYIEKPHIDFEASFK